MKDEITADEDLITAERLAKGDLQVLRNARGKISRAVSAQVPVIKELIRREVLSYHHEIYGVGFLELRAAFRAPWAIRSGAVLLSQWGQGVSASYVTEIYQNVWRGLGPDKLAVVQFALEEAFISGDSKEVRGNDSKYSDSEYSKCFDKLVRMMDEERERILKLM